MPAQTRVFSAYRRRLLRFPSVHPDRYLQPSQPEGRECPRSPLQPPSLHDLHPTPKSSSSPPPWPETTSTTSYTPSIASSHAHKIADLAAHNSSPCSCRPSSQQSASQPKPTSPTLLALSVVP